MRQPTKQLLSAARPASRPTRPLRRSSRRGAVHCASSSRGVGLLDAVIALVILSFGVLGMTRLQGRLVAQGSEAQQRLVATQLGDELLSSVLVDVNNAACYTLPQSGVCGNNAAAARTSTWATRVAAALPGPATSTATINGDRLTVSINWTGKGSGDTRTLDLDVISACTVLYLIKGVTYILFFGTLAGPDGSSKKVK